MKRVLQIVSPGFGGSRSVANTINKGLNDDVNTITIVEFPPYIYFRRLRQELYLFGYLLATKPDVILVHSISYVSLVIFYKFIFRKKMFSVLHTGGSKLSLKLRIFSYLALRFSDKTIVLNDRYLRIYGLSKFAKRTIIIHNSSSINVSTDREREDKSSFRVGMAGRFVKGKRQDLLCMAFGKWSLAMPKYELRLAGDGPTLNTLQAQFKNIPNVHFNGLITDIKGWLTSLDIYCQISSSEVMSISILDAGMMGLPILCSDIPANRYLMELVDYGIVLCQNTTEDIKAQISYMMTVEWDNERISKTFKALFSEDIMCENYKKLISNE